MARAGTRAAPVVERFFELSLLGLVTSGYLAVAGSGRLDLPTMAVAAAGLLLRGLMAAGLLRLAVPRRAVAAGAAAYICFYPLDYAALSRSFLTATVHLVFFVAIVLVITARTNREYAYLKVLALVELLAASLLSDSPNFFLFLALFMLFGVATMASAEIRRSAERAGATARGGLEHFHWRLASLTLFAGAGILSLTAGFFFVLPRTAHAAFRHFVPDRYHLPGFSNEVMLGRTGEIAEQSLAVMHVRIVEANHPPRFKWRGAALGSFDGKRWFNPPQRGEMLPVEGGLRILANPEQRLRAGRRITYEVRLKPAGSDALFFTGIPEVLWINAPGVVRTPDGGYRLGYEQPQGLRYAAYSYIEGPAPGNAGACLEQGEFTRLPALDPRIRRLAGMIAAGKATPEAKAQAVEAYLRSNYRYTTDLPAGEVPDPLAEFLFDRKRGHCEYFAASMAAMLRTLGIPSRVANGFETGIYNPVSGWYVVRASDAHSWVEACLPSSGWTAFDPTPPDRTPTTLSLWTRMGFYLDAAEMFWQDWVLNYDLSQQLTLAERMESSGRRLGARWLDRLRAAAALWRGRAAEGVRRYGPWAAAGAVLLGVCIPLGRFLLRWWKRELSVRRVKRGRVEASDATLLYERMLVLLERRGFRKPSWQTPAEFARVLPGGEMAAVASSFTRAYNELRFGGRQEAAARLTVLLEQLERM